MAARVSNKVVWKQIADFLLMHAMGPTLAGVIAAAVAAGTLLGVVGLIAERGNQKPLNLSGFL